MNCIYLKIKPCTGCKLFIKNIHNTYDPNCVIQVYRREIQYHIDKNSLKKAFVFWLPSPYLSRTIEIYYPEHLELFIKLSILK